MHLETNPRQPKPSPLRDKLAFITILNILVSYNIKKLTLNTTFKATLAQILSR